MPVLKDANTNLLISQELLKIIMCSIELNIISHLKY